MLLPDFNEIFELPLFLHYTEYSRGWDKKMNTRDKSLEFHLLFPGIYTYVDVLNYLEHSTFGIRPPPSVGWANILEKRVFK